MDVNRKTDSASTSISSFQPLWPALGIALADAVLTVEKRKADVGERDIHTGVRITCSIHLKDWSSNSRKFVWGRQVRRKPRSPIYSLLYLHPLLRFAQREQRPPAP